MWQLHSRITRPPRRRTSAMFAFSSAHAPGYGSSYFGYARSMPSFHQAKRKSVSMPYLCPASYIAGRSLNV